MKQKFDFRAFMLSVIFFISQPLQANDTDVANWAQKVLLTTLSVSFDDKENHYKEVRPFYSYEAWKALKNFFSQYLDTIENKKLTLHPMVVGQPIVLHSGVVKDNNFFDGVQYWMIEQSFYIPEIKLNIHFAVLVLSQDREGLQIWTINVKLD